MSKGLAGVKTLTAKEIAKKWNLPLAIVTKKIAAGVKVEKEHTTSLRQANEIARDHLGERPDYYDKLKKMEKKAIVKENSTLTAAVAGLGFNTGVPAVESDNEYVNTNALARDPLNGAILDLIDKKHQSLHDSKLGFKQFNPKKLKTSSNKDLAESLGSDYGTASVPVIGDLTGSSRKVMKVDEVKIPPKVKKAVAVGMTAANIATGAQVYDHASRNVGNPIRDVAALATGVPGKVGMSITPGHYALKGLQKTREYIKSKQQAKNMEEQGSPANPARYTERPMYERNGRLPAGEVERGIYEVSAELVGKVSNARFWRKEAPSKTLSRAINKKFIESGKKKEESKKPVKEEEIKKDVKLMGNQKPDAWDYGAKGTTKTIHEQIKKAVREAVMAMPPQVQPPAIHGSQRAGVQRQVSKPTEVSGRAGGRMSGASGNMSARPNVKVSSGVHPSIERSWKTSGRATVGSGGGSMSATPKVSSSYSQGGVNVGKGMAASRQTSPVVKGMTDAGRQAATAVTKAAPMASKVAGAALRIAGGPAATAAAAVMSPTPAGAGEDEKKRQDTLKSYNPYKASGRSVADYEKQALTPQKYDTPKAAPGPEVDAPKAPRRPEYFTRGQAFQAARGEAGGGEGKFSYQSGTDTAPKTYQTNVSGEKYKPETQLKQTSVKEETTMDTKELINEALDDILDNNLVSMKENLMFVLQEKAMEKLEERKKIISANYFAQ